MMEILTKEDLKPLVLLNEKMVDAMQVLIGKKPTVILRGSEIRKRLGLKSAQTFADRIPELLDFGLFKDGHYSITEADLERYIEYLKTKHLPK